MSDTVLCIDIGTTSLKAALITAQGEVVSFCSVSYEDSHDRFIACSWYAAFLRAAQLLSKNCEVPRVCIKGIAISGNGPTVVTDCGLTFSWKRALGVTKVKRKIAKATGIPTTRQGRRAKFARLFRIR